MILKIEDNLKGLRGVERVTSISRENSGSITVEVEEDLDGLADALKKLGAKIKIKNGYILAEAKKGLKGAIIKFPSISVGATENALLAACKARGKTILKNCATI